MVACERDQLDESLSLAQKGFKLIEREGIKNIYSKLAVDKRAAVAARARSLGLIQ